jgi:predicted ATP-grasp superfamily ATP-dependent carboligase
MADPSRLLILGVSARAAAFSAIRAGYVTLAADCFQDEDLAVACQCRRVERYPAGFEAVAAGWPDCPWLYTGGLENHPKLVGRIAARRPLLGNPERVLRQVRDPFELADALRQAGLPCLDVSATPPDDSRGEWLRKPRKSGGGRRIEFISRIVQKCPVPGASIGAFNPDWPPGRERFYYQRYVAGMACSAVFVAARGRAVLLGTTQQLIGAAWTGARGFEYAGSLGPLDVSPDELTRWERIGNCLASRFGLCGLFGVDAVMTDGAVWVVEVNPRYTASVEVLELACDVNLLPLHVRACQNGELPGAWSVPPRRRAGKAIVFAEKGGRVPAEFGHFVKRLNSAQARPVVADIPAVGRGFVRGQPLVTVLAEGDSLSEVERSLRQTVALVQASLACV